LRRRRDWGLGLYVGWYDHVHVHDHDYDYVYDYDYVHDGGGCFVVGG
jgi:hypothetical protein